MNPVEPIPDIEPIVSSDLAEAGWPLLHYLIAALGVAFVIWIIISLIRWKPAKKKRIEVKKDMREVALDVLHRLKEDHLRIPAHELASQAQPAFSDYIEAKRAQPGIGLPEASVEELQRIEEEFQLLRYSRTPDADGRRQALIESLLHFVREDPFQKRKNAESTAHTAPA